MKNKKIYAWMSLILGILISATTHFYMLYQGFMSMPMSNIMMIGHAILNLIGLSLIIAGIVLKR